MAFFVCHPTLGYYDVFLSMSKKTCSKKASYKILRLQFPHRPAIGAGAASFHDQPTFG